VVSDMVSAGPRG